MHSAAVNHRVTIRRLENIEDTEWYRDLFCAIFPNQSHTPGTFIYGAENADGQIVGFISAYLSGPDNGYIQFAGFLPEYRGLSVLPIFLKALDFIHRDFKFLMCTVSNNNIPAIRMALAAGFRINGVNQRSDKTLFVEFLKEGP